MCSVRHPKWEKGVGCLVRGWAGGMPVRDKGVVFLGVGAAAMGGRNGKWEEWVSWPMG